MVSENLIYVVSLCVSHVSMYFRFDEEADLEKLVLSTFLQKTFGWCLAYNSVD